MDERTTGLIIRLRPLTETSLIVHWITRDLGRLATVAKGARRTNSPFRGKLDLFYLAHLSLRRSRRSDLHTLLEVDLRETHAALRENWDRLQLSGYAAALVEVATETDTPIPELFEILTDFISYSAQAPARALHLLAFETKMLVLLGLDPRMQTEHVPDANTWALLADSDWKALTSLDWPPAQLRRFGNSLQNTLASSFGRVPKTRAATWRALTATSD